MQILHRSRRLSVRHRSSTTPIRTQVRKAHLSSQSFIKSFESLAYPTLYSFLTGDEDAAEKFTKINRALEVLTDDVKR